MRTITAIAVLIVWLVCLGAAIYWQNFGAGFFAWFGGLPLVVMLESIILRLDQCRR